MHKIRCLCLALLPALHAAPAAADLAQDRFVTLILQSREQLGEALDAATVDAVLGERRSAQCSLSLEQGLEAKGWSGVVEAVAPQDGAYVLSVAFAEGALVATSAPLAETGSAQSLVLADGSATGDVALLAPQDRVVFSGHFLPMEEGCLAQVPSDPPGDMIRSPRYLFVFTEVKKH